MNMKIQLAVTLAGGMLLAASDLNAQDEMDHTGHDDAEHCINLNLIERTDVVSDRMILFHMRDDRVYKNTLPHRCAGLKFEDAFLYQPHAGRLCDLDAVTVLDRSGFGFSRGPTCGLGLFYEISEEESERLAGQRSD